MPLKITQRPEHEVPKPSRAGKVNEDLVAVKNEMMKLGQGMVLEIEAGSEKAIRGAKALITRAAKELGTTVAPLALRKQGICETCRRHSTPEGTGEKEPVVPTLQAIGRS